MDKKKKNNLYDFDYELEKEEKDKKKKAKKKKADAKSASNKKSKHSKEEGGQATKKKKYDDEIIIGVTQYPEKKPEASKKSKDKNKKNTSKNTENKRASKAKNKTENKNTYNNKNRTTQKNRDEISQALTINVPRNIINKQNTIENEKAIKRKNKILKSIAIILLIIVAVTFAMVSPLFNLQNITITGNEQISKEEITSLSGITLEENIFRINNLKLIENITQNAYINEVTIHKKLPNTIEISVIERKPSYMLQYGNGYVYLNNQGYMLEISSIKKALPIIIGTTTSKEDYKAGNRLNEEDLKKLSTVIKITNAAQNSEIANLITTIDITDTDNYTLYLETENKTVYLGDCSNLETRMLFVAAILEKEKDIKGEVFVNMNLNTDAPYFRESV